MELQREIKLRFVDALRGIAILGVMMIHCRQNGTNVFAPLLDSILIHGAIGVQLFFVTSAFTIFLTYGNRYTKEENPVSNFLVRRFFRIAPMYYLGMLYFLWQNGLGPSYWLGDAMGISLWNIGANLLFIHSMNPYWITSVVPGGWSIAVEASFYCLVPFLFLRIRNLNQAFILFLCTLLIRMTLQALLQYFPLISSDRLWREYLFFYPPDQFPVFACGILLFYLVYTSRPDWRIEPWAVGAFGLLLLAQLATSSTFIFPEHIQFAMAFVVLGYALFHFEIRILVNTVTVFIGKISYSMYLVHFAVMHWLTEFGYVDLAPPGIPYYYEITYLLRFGVLALLTIMISACTYRLIEVPLQNMGKRIVKQREAQHAKSLRLA